LRQVLDPVLAALAVLHDARCLHRDIAPDNILITATGPLLLDFGAARRVIGDATQSLTAMLKIGYAPVEQYGQIESLRQGPWTDIYALACVAYYAITGKRPMASLDRLMQDRLRPLGEQAAARYSAGFLRAIDAGLAVAPEARPRSIAEFRALLGGAPIPGAPDGAAVARESLATLPWPPKQASVPGGTYLRTGRPTTRATSTNAPRRKLPALAGYAAAAVLIVGGAAIWWVVSQRGPEAPPSPPVRPPVQTVSTAANSSPLAPPAAPQPGSAAPPAAGHPGESIRPPAAPATESEARRAAARESAAAQSAAAPTPRADRAREHTRVAHDAPVAAPPAPSVKQATARCADLLQKASIEPLSGEDLAYWRKECS
jgi:serine/threonine protein kinase